LTPEQQAQKWPDHFLKCRDVGHFWDRHVINVDADERFVTRTWWCGRCTCVRSETIVRRSGEVLRRGYKHPAGFLSIAGRIYKNTIRVEAIERDLGTPRKRRR
jgi:hypothetical protein